MTKALNTFLCTILFVGLAAAQDYQRVDVFGGYSYLNADFNGLVSRQNFNGWETSTSFNINRWAAAEADISGYYKGNFLGSGVNVDDYAYVFGPRFNFRYAFVHALFGVDHLTGSYSGLSASQNAFASALGGGVQYKVAPHFAVRVSTDYVLTRHNVLDGGNRVNQNNFRVAVGAVYSFGGVQKQAALLQQQPTVSRVKSPQHAANLPLGQDRLKTLGISGQSKSVYGFTVTAVVPGSPAERSGIVVSDCIVAVNGAPVRTEDDVASALSTSSGKAVISISKPSWLPNQTEQHEIAIQ